MGAVAPNRRPGRWCRPCAAVGRRQVAHRVLPDGTPKCKWCWQGLAHPASRNSAGPEPAPVREEEAMHPPRVDIPWKDVAAAYQGGASLRELAQKHKCSMSFVSKNLKELGVPRRRGRSRAAPSQARGPKFVDGDLDTGLPRGSPSLAPEAPPWDHVRYRLVERTEKAIGNGGSGSCVLRFADVEDSSRHQLTLQTVPAVSRQFQLGKEYLFSWEERP